MDNKLLLTPENVLELTGLRRPTSQMKWLRENGIVFLVGGDGNPKVIIESVLNRFDKNLRNGHRQNRAPEVRV